MNNHVMSLHKGSVLGERLLRYIQMMPSNHSEFQSHVIEKVCASCRVCVCGMGGGGWMPGHHGGHAQQPQRFNTYIFDNVGCSCHALGRCCNDPHCSSVTARLPAHCQCWPLPWMHCIVVEGHAGLGVR